MERYNSCSARYSPLFVRVKQRTYDAEYTRTATYIFIYQEWDYIITYEKTLKWEIDKRNVICILFSIRIWVHTDILHLCSIELTCRTHCSSAGIYILFLLLIFHSLSRYLFAAFVFYVYCC